MVHENNEIHWIEQKIVEVNKNKNIWFEFIICLLNLVVFQTILKIYEKIKRKWPKICLNKYVDEKY